MCFWKNNFFEKHFYERILEFFHSFEHKKNKKFQKTNFFETFDDFTVSILILKCWKLLF